MKDVEIEGSLPGTSAAAGAREEYTLRSARCTTMKDVEIEGSLPGTSAAAGAREEYTLRSATEKLLQVLKEMEFFRSLFYSFYLHDFGRTASPPRSYGVMRGACSVGVSFPGGDDMRVQFYLVGDKVVPYQ